MGLTFAAVLEDVEARDKRDSERATAPLKPADDAVMLDTTDLTADAAIACAISLVAAARS
jgi:cytidylate kinase